MSETIDFKVCDFDTEKRERHIAREVKTAYLTEDGVNTLSGQYMADYRITVTVERLEPSDG